MDRKIHYYFDLDGVLARWNEKVSEYDTWKEGYFLTCSPEPNAIECVKLMVDQGWKVSILGAAYNDRVIGDKKQWLDKAGLPKEAERIFVPYGDNKADYARPGEINVLIDDHTPNLAGWAGYGFAGIKFRNHINCRGKNGLASWRGPSVSYTMSAKDMAAVISGYALMREQLNGKPYKLA